ncbi:hypothetical protein [Marinomonas spartinae]|uniref:hypothetical protein n=1 Tax=Marinomonas spartinae TaxID=1792290 RepID=UPI0018F132CF|nr:hypothetical protein [Marinomonas spartinae]MBJ7555141.1 hypothetical protein [Marinomonas spartinae]
MSNTDLSTKIVPWLGSYELGYGVDFFSKQIRKSAIKNPKSLQSKPSTGDGRGWQSVVSNYQRIEKKEELIKNLTIDFNIAGSNPSSSFSFISQFVDNVKINKFNIYITLTINVQNYEEVISSDFDIIKVDENLTENNTERLYGDHFINGYITGGFYLAIIEIKTDTEEKKQEVLSKLSANQKDQAKDKKDAGTASKDEDKSKSDSDSDKESTGNGLKFMLEKVAKLENVELKIDIRRVGASGKLNLTDLKELLKDADDFPQKVANNGRPLFAIIKPWALTDFTFPSIQSSLVKQYELFSLQIHRRIQRFLSLQEDIQWAIDHHSSQTFVESKQSLIDIKADIIKRLNLSNGLLEALHSNPKAFLTASPDTDQLGIHLLPQLMDWTAIPDRILKTQKYLIQPSISENPYSLVITLQPLLSGLGKFHTDVKHAINTLVENVIETYRGLSECIENVILTFESVDMDVAETLLNKEVTLLLEDLSCKWKLEFTTPLVTLQNFLEPNISGEGLLGAGTSDFSQRDINCVNQLLAYLSPNISSSDSLLGGYLQLFSELQKEFINASRTNVDMFETAELDTAAWRELQTLFWESSVKLIKLNVVK